MVVGDNRGQKCACGRCTGKRIPYILQIHQAGNDEFICGVDPESIWENLDLFLRAYFDDLIPGYQDRSLGERGDFRCRR